MTSKDAQSRRNYHLPGIYLVRLHLARTNTIQSNMHFVASILQSNRTGRRDVFEEVHLPSTSFLKAIYERVDNQKSSWDKRFHLFITILEKSADVYHIDNFSSPASSFVLWCECLQPCEWNVTRRWLIIPSQFWIFNIFFKSIKIWHNCGHESVAPLLWPTL